MEINSTFYHDTAGPARRCEVLHSQMFTQPSIAGEDEVNLGEFPEFQFQTHRIKYESDSTYYGMRIVTGRDKGSGSITTGYFAHLLGSDSYSEAIRLQKSVIRHKLSRNSYDDVIIKVEDNHDLGDIEVLMIGNEGYGSWFLECIELYQMKNSSKHVFPCRHWVVDGNSITLTSKACIPRGIRDSTILSSERQYQIKSRQNLYQWNIEVYGLLPSHFDDEKLSHVHDEEFEKVKDYDFKKDTASSIPLFLEIVMHLPGHNFTMKEYERLASKLEVPEISVSKIWKSDEEFGRQMLNGINPVVITKFTSPLSNFPVSSRMVQPSLAPGKTLEEEMKAGRVYVCDLKIMDGLHTRPKYHCAAPICLLYVNSNNMLVPIAIQLKQGVREEERDQPNPIFLPTDNETDWILAKIYYQNAHSQFHQIYTHFLCCHAAMEAYTVGTMRNLPDAHPICKLLRPFFRYTIAINHRARASLINDNGTLDSIFSIGGEGRVELMRRSYDIYNVHDTNIKRNIAKRDVSDIPDYYYRDDGIKVWEALEEYVRNVVNYFYACDKEVQEDSEIQSFAKDVHDKGFIGSGEKCGHGFPDKISTKAELIEYCTLIMFTGSAQHASVNFGQYDYYGFVPNAPFSLRHPPLDEKGKTKDEDVLECLPDKMSVLISIAATHLLSKYSEDERFLGSHLKGYFTEPDVRNFIKSLQESLQSISKYIEDRNLKLDVPGYTLMDPQKIPNSITI